MNNDQIIIIEEKSTSSNFFFYQICTNITHNTEYLQTQNTHTHIKQQNLSESLSMKEGWWEKDAEEEDLLKGNKDDPMEDFCWRKTVRYNLQFTIFIINFY